MSTPDPAKPEPPSGPTRPAGVLGWSGLTDRGRFRANNEDAFLALAFDGHEIRYLGKTGQAALDTNDFVFAVSDGLGGAKSGEFASRIAVDRISRLLPRAFRLSAAGLASGFTDVLEELFEEIHHDMLKLGQSYEECAGMGATLTVGWFTPEWMYFGHVGDSRLYHLPAGGGLKQLSRDDSHVGWLRRQGRINEREHRTHPQRNALSQALGAGHQFIDPQIGAVGLQPGDRFVFCTDGVNDGLWDRQIEEIVLAAPAAGQASAACRLVQDAVAHSGRDNATAVVVEIPLPSPTPA